MKRKIYVVGGDVGYANWMEGEIVRFLPDADLVVFTGGEDVTPLLYKESDHPKTYYNTHRDISEMKHFNAAAMLGKKLVGICRGAQFLCVMAGGKLVQDQEVQPRYHPMSTHDDQERITVSSTHHQAQYPWGLPPQEFKLLGFTQRLSGWHENGNEKEIVNDITPGSAEVEVCYYPKINALGIQPHPEYYFNSQDLELKRSIAYFQDLLNKHMENKL